MLVSMDIPGRWSSGAGINRLQFTKEILLTLRYIPWIHVGIAARTGIAILKQSLNRIEDTNILPQAIRSDRGTETTMMANAHWQLHREHNIDIRFEDIYWYGTSTWNQRIESWWRQMSKSQTLAWKVRNSW